MPVLVAELTVGVEAILYTAKRSIETDVELLLGLPLNCQPTILDNRICLQSSLQGDMTFPIALCMEKIF